jgi:hypothetical protein
MDLKQKLEAAAKLLDCKPGELMAYRDLEDGGLSVIAPTGQKFIYGAEKLEKAARAATRRSQLAAATGTGKEAAKRGTQPPSSKAAPKPRSAGAKPARKSKR